MLYLRSLSKFIRFRCEALKQFLIINQDCVFFILHLIFPYANVVVFIVNKKCIQIKFRFLLEHKKPAAFSYSGRSWEQLHICQKNSSGFRFNFIPVYQMPYFSNAVYLFKNYYLLEY